MESRFRVLLLISVLSLGLQGCSVFGGNKQQSASDEPAATPSPAEKPVIEPQVERRKITTPKIKSSDFELGAYGGILGIEDFGSNFVYGVVADVDVEVVAGSFFIAEGCGFDGAACSFIDEVFCHADDGELGTVVYPKALSEGVG